MINPFTPMNIKFIPAFRSKGKRYLVLQNFTLEDHLFKKDKKYVLVSHYDDKGKAQEHYTRVQQQEVAKIIDLENDAERQALESMLNINSEYVLYSVLVTNPAAVERALDTLKYKIKKYIDDKPKWHISREHTLRPELETVFGELQVVMKYSGHTIKVPLKVIETY
ncbi:MAG: hypothetical protein M3Z56_10475 [Bacteroidota bacterium]|nr:hypothetical protein [Bacteroidota bacterium]